MNIWKEILERKKKLNVYMNILILHIVILGSKKKKKKEAIYNLLLTNNYIKNKRTNSRFYILIHVI